MGTFCISIAVRFFVLAFMNNINVENAIQTGIYFDACVCVCVCGIRL